jgi:UDP-N-acetylglucosamine:LPS N-acetylglucosamine transferase
MLHMLSALEQHELIVMTSDSRDAFSVPASRYFAVREASRWSRSKGFSTFLQLMFLIPRLRADVVLSTGAAPGFLAVMLGRLTGSRVIWVDSLANVDRVSLGGRLARVFTHLFLVQWPDLADGRRAQYRGRVK